MAELSSRLELLRPEIEELMRIGGTVGLTMGVMHHGSSVYQANFGFRDVAQALPMTDQTILPVASFTKAVTAAAVGILVEQKKVTWNTLVKDAVPDFSSRDEILQKFTTITDLLAHRTGLAKSDNLWLSTENNVLIDESNATTFINSQPRTRSFRGQFAYSNVAYDLAGKVIESLSKESYSDFVQSHIFDPLGMVRTYLKTPSIDVENVSKCYNTLDDGSPACIPCPKVGDDCLAGASCGMRTCVHDLLKLYKRLLLDSTIRSTQVIPTRKIQPSNRSPNSCRSRSPLTGLPETRRPMR
nr:protein flp [Quercus suber]